MIYMILDGDNWFDSHLDFIAWVKYILHDAQKNIMKDNGMLWILPPRFHDNINISKLTKM